MNLIARLTNGATLGFKIFRALSRKIVDAGSCDNLVLVSYLSSKGWKRFGSQFAVANRLRA